MITVIWLAYLFIVFIGIIANIYIQNYTAAVWATASAVMSWGWWLLARRS